MTKDVLKWVYLGVLGFHLFAVIYSFLTFFGADQPRSLYQFTPFCLLLFGLAWLGIVLKKRWCAFAYLLLTIYELMMQFFFHNSTFGEVFGKVLFPADLIFLSIVVLSYRAHFNSNNA